MITTRHLCRYKGINCHSLADISGCESFFALCFYLSQSCLRKLRRNWRSVCDSSIRETIINSSKFYVFGANTNSIVILRRGRRKFDWMENNLTNKFMVNVNGLLTNNLFDDMACEACSTKFTLFIKRKVSKTLPFFES